MTLVHIRHSSQKYSDSKADVEFDAENVIPRADAPGAPTFITLGEAEKVPRPDRFVHPVFKARAEAMGYHYFGPESDSAVLRNRHTLDLLDATYTPTYTHVLDARREKPGAYSDKGVCEATGVLDDGTIVTVETQHLLTAWKADTKPGPENRREQFYIEQMDTMFRRALVNGEGDRVVFITTDANADAERDRGQDPDWFHATFNRYGFESCWDDLGEYPSTHGGERGSTIDYVLRSLKDLRVTFRGAKVGAPGNTRARRSDHRLVDALYEVAPLVVPVPPTPVLCGQPFTCTRPVDAAGRHVGRHRAEQIEETP